MIEYMQRNSFCAFGKLSPQLVIDRNLEIINLGYISIFIIVGLRE